VILSLLASIAVAVTFGMVISRAVAIRGGAAGPALVLFSSLAVAFGLGVASSLHFGWLLVFGPAARELALAEVGLLLLGAAAAILVFRRHPHPDPVPVRHEPGAAPALIISSLVVIGCAVAGFAALSAREPHGGWDAWMTWNVHARFLFRGGDEWLMMFSDASRLRHPDYPFLVPSLVARSWSYIGVEHLAAPAVLGFLFTFATVGVLGSTLAVLRGHSQGLLAAMLLVSTPFFVVHGTSQYADVPLGLYLTTTLALLCLHDRFRLSGNGSLLLAGLAAGLAAWTKNEGLLFLLALVIARAATVLPAAGIHALWKELRPFGAGLLPILILLCYFKLAIAPSNDLVSTSSQGVQSTLERLVDPGRYLYIAENYASTALSFGRNGLVSVGWLLLTYALCLGLVRGGMRSAGVRTGVLTLGMVVLGQAVVYLTAPAGMERLLDASLERLFLQLWPGVLLLYFMIVRAPEETLGDYRTVQPVIPAVFDVKPIRSVSARAAGPRARSR
jgi:hypothetical protein